MVVRHSKNNVLEMCSEMVDGLSLKLFGSLRKVVEMVCLNWSGWWGDDAEMLTPYPCPLSAGIMV